MRNYLIQINGWTLGTFVKHVDSNHKQDREETVWSEFKRTYPGCSVFVKEVQ